MTPLLTSIGQIAMTVDDVPRATAFYRDILGLRYLFKGGSMVFFDCGGVRLMLTPPEHEPRKNNSILYFKTDDLHGAFKTLTDRDIRFLSRPQLTAKMPDHELWMAFFQDSEGNVLALMSEVREPL